MRLRLAPWQSPFVFARFWRWSVCKHCGEGPMTGTMPLQEDRGRAFVSSVAHQVRLTTISVWPRGHAEQRVKLQLVFLECGGDFAEVSLLSRVCFCRWSELRFVSRKDALSDLSLSWSLERTERKFSRRNGVPQSREEKCRMQLNQIKTRWP